MARKTIDELLGGEKRFGLLTVVGEGKQHKAAGPVGQTTRTIRFRCDCGSVVDLRPSAIRYGKKSCGCVAAEWIRAAIPFQKVESGARFNRWTVLGEQKTSPRENGRLRTSVLCRCDCGTESHVWVDTLRRNTSKSCGCYRVEASRKRQTSHGHSRIGKVGRGTPEYAAWTNMIRRCKNPDHPHYPGYGGRGITVCEEWRNDFAAFLRDMGTRPSKRHSIDRRDVNGNYEVVNCRWATLEVQASNKRNTRYIEFRGQTMPLMEAAKLADIQYCTAARRLNDGWSVERALLTPGRPFTQLKRKITGSNSLGVRRGAVGTHSSEDIRRIHKQQRGKCAYCKRSLKRFGLHRDHIVSVANGGTNYARNMQLLCEDCNRSKGAKPPEEFARKMGLLV